MTSYAAMHFSVAKKEADSIARNPDTPPLERALASVLAELAKGLEELARSK